MIRKEQMRACMQSNNAVYSLLFFGCTGGCLEGAVFFMWEIGGNAKHRFLKIASVSSFYSRKIIQHPVNNRSYKYRLARALASFIVCRHGHLHLLSQASSRIIHLEYAVIDSHSLNSQANIYLICQALIEVIQSACVHPIMQILNLAQRLPTQTYRPHHA